MTDLMSPSERSSKLKFELSSSIFERRWFAVFTAAEFTDKCSSLRFSARFSITASFSSICVFLALICCCKERYSLLKIGV